MLVQHRYCKYGVLVDESVVYICIYLCMVSALSIV